MNDFHIAFVEHVKRFTGITFLNDGIAFLEMKCRCLIGQFADGVFTELNKKWVGTECFFDLGKIGCEGFWDDGWWEDF